MFCVKKNFPIDSDTKPENTQVAFPGQNKKETDSESEASLEIDCDDDSKEEKNDKEEMQENKIYN